jgi:hypothetical protein
MIDRKNLGEGGLIRAGPLESSPSFRSYLSHLSWPFWGVCALFMTLSVWQGGLIAADSGAYVHMSLHRSALYPLLLRLYFLFFGEETLRPLVVLQTSFCFSGALFFLHTIQKGFSVGVRGAFFIFLLLLSPNIGTEPYCRQVMTEGFSYPLWLFAAGQLVLFLKEGSAKACRGFFWLSALLVLTRRQFLFLYPIILLILIGLFTFLKDIIEKRHRFPLVLCTISSFILADIFERGYHFVVHGAFRHVPFTGQNLVVLPFWCARTLEVHFPDKRQEGIFKEAQRIVKEEGLPSDKILGSMKFFYDESTCRKTMIEVVQKALHCDPWKQDSILSKMAIDLFQQVPSACFLTYLKQLITTYVPLRGGTGGFAVLWSAVVSLVVAVYRRADPKGRRLLECVMCLFGTNVCSIALTMPIFARYTVYTDVFLGSIVLALVFSSAGGGLLSRSESRADRKSL